MAGRYTTYLDRDPSNVRAEMMENLNQKISGVGDIYLQQKLKEKERQKELQDAVKKAVIESVLTGKGKFKTPIDLNQLVSGGQLPNLSEFEATPDVTQMRSLLGMQDLSRKMEQQRRLGVMAGQEAPSTEEIAQFTPQLQKTVLGGGQPISEGGFVGLPKGATFGEGNIMDIAGQRIGEYMPGYEPKTLPVEQEEIAGAMREKFAGGVTKEELSRKALGLPRFTGRATQNQLVTVATKLAQAENPMAGEKEIQAKIPTAQKMLEGNVFSGKTSNILEEEYTDEQEQVIQDNMDAYPDKTREEIIEALQAQGYL